MSKKPTTVKHPKYLVTKHFGNGMMHHVGGPRQTREELEPFLKDSNYRGNYKGHVWLSVWKLDEEIEVG